MAKNPDASPSSSFPFSSKITGCTPKNGNVADPGLSGVAPGSGVIMKLPVSVCQYVSTIGHRPSPTTLWYQRHASGLMGSPTEPKMRSDERSCRVTYSSPAFMSARTAVGAV